MKAKDNLIQIHKFKFTDNEGVQQSNCCLWSTIFFIVPPEIQFFFNAFDAKFYRYLILQKPLLKKWSGSQEFVWGEGFSKIQKIVFRIFADE